MKSLYPYLLLLAALSITGCSGSSTPGSNQGTFEGEPNSTADQTCYDIRFVNAGNVQNKTLCTTRENGGYNGLGTNRFIRFTVNAFATVSLQVTRSSGINPADPDIILYKNGVIIDEAETFAFNEESLSANLNAGNYVFEVREFVYAANDEKPQPNFNSQQKATFDNTNQQSSDTPVSTCSNVSESTVSGTVRFLRVNHTGSSLDYTNVTYELVQQAVVEVICNGGVFSSGVTSANGFYALTFPDAQSSFVRVKAQMLNADNWDFSVVDNTVSTQPIYAMDGNAFNETTNITRNLEAGSGWTGISYGLPRVAAPFAILDSIRKAKDKILSVATVKFPALKINWSPVNSALNNTGTFYSNNEIFLSGKENTDTDEYDEHVIIHEWGHYFEDNFSRSDSIGGIHSMGDIIDIRVAFGEGFGNAFSAIVMDDPFYIDTSGREQANGFSINMENNNCINQGWFSECSIQSIVYDLYDDNVDGVDNINMNFSSIYNVLVGEQRSTQALTSIFSFIKPLKNQNPADANNIDALLNAQSIDSINDIYGSSQISANPGLTSQLPIYETY